MKIVDFELCKTCVHFKDDESEDICNECLNCPAREDSHTPINHLTE